MLTASESDVGERREITVHRENRLGNDEHALGCDSLCAQCTGFIPGIFAAPSERMSSTTRFPLTGTDPVPQYGPPLYKPPRA